MELKQTTEQSKRTYQFLLISAIIIVAFNLRPGITSVGPLIGMIRDDVGLANWSAGLLTSLPLVAFAIMSPIAPKLGNKYTNERAMLIGLVILILGIGTRSISNAILLFSGTLLVGFGIAILNVLLPGFIKSSFPTKVGVITGIYTTSMSLMAAGGSGLSVPLATGLGLGWKLALAVWVIPATLGLSIWVYLAKKQPKGKKIEVKSFQSNNRMWKDKLAWQVALYMGLQSFLFYVTISWLPEILHHQGISMATAGWMLSFTQFIGLPASFAIPVLAEKFTSQRILVGILSTLSIIGYGGLLVSNSFPILIISCICIGFFLAGTFALALTFLGIRAKTPKDAAELSGMAQSLGYILAAFGPILIGFLFDITGSWTVSIITIIVDAMLVFMFGMFAGRNRYVLDN